MFSSFSFRSLARRFESWFNFGTWISCCAESLFGRCWGSSMHKLGEPNQGQLISPVQGFVQEFSSCSLPSYDTPSTKLIFCDWGPLPNTIRTEIPDNCHSSNPCPSWWPFQPGCSPRGTSSRLVCSNPHSIQAGINGGSPAAQSWGISCSKK